MLYSGNLFHIQRHTKTQNKVKEDLPSKWRTKRAVVAIIVSDKMDFKPTKIKRDTEGHYRNGKRINETRRANYPKYMCAQYRNTEIHKAG